MCSTVYFRTLPMGSHSVDCLFCKGWRKSALIFLLPYVLLTCIMENEILNQLWEAFQVFNPILAASIVAVTEIIKSQVKNSPRWVTFAVGIVLTAIYYFIADGANLVQVIAPFLAAVFAYDFAVQPLSKSKEKDPPIGGGGGGPVIN